MTGKVIQDEFVFCIDDPAAMKSLGARWDTAWDGWSLPATRMNAQSVLDLNIGLPDLREKTMPTRTLSEYIVDPRLYDYQREAVARLLWHPHGQLLCLSPGLGKTAVAIVAADILVTHDRIVIVAPASLLKTWEREIRKWSSSPGEIYVIKGKIDYARALYSRWLIVSWEKAVNLAQEWSTGWPLWIFDESVLVKSRKSKRFKVLAKLRKGIKHAWLLSGSPTTKFSDDLWSQLHLIWPKAFPSYWRFAERYTIVEETPWARKIAGDRHGRDAMTDNSDLVFVVNQEDVLDLPEYLFEVIDIELTTEQRKAYDSMAATFIASLSGNDVIAVNEIARLQKLQQIASSWDGRSAKVKTLSEIIPTYEGPYLVWTYWKETAQAAKIALEGAGLRVALVTGETTDKDALIEGYKVGEYDVLVISMGVGKFGHTLTNTKTIFYLDKTWNADDYFQSLHRVRRIGLEHHPVVVTLRAPGTVDELVEDNLAGKLKTVSKMTRSDLATLLKGLR